MELPKMARKTLSTTTATFIDIIKDNGMYLDKTEEIYQMVSKRKGQFFLSRPRRFGKSLTLSTLESFFLGDKDLFKGFGSCFKYMDRYIDEN